MAPWLARVNDSKMLSHKEREKLFPLIQGWVRAWAVGTANVTEIDRINIFHASHLAMVRAVKKLKVKALKNTSAKYIDIGTSDELDAALKKFHL